MWKQVDWPILLYQGIYYENKYSDCYALEYKTLWHKKACLRLLHFLLLLSKQKYSMQLYIVDFISKITKGTEISFILCSILHGIFNLEHDV